jgi:hypothetical protein
MARCGVLELARLWCPSAVQAVAAIGPHPRTEGATEIPNLIQPLVVSEEE